MTNVLNDLKVKNVGVRLKFEDDLCLQVVFTDSCGVAQNFIRGEDVE